MTTVSLDTEDDSTAASLTEVESALMKMDDADVSKLFYATLNEIGGPARSCMALIAARNNCGEEEAIRLMQLHAFT